MSSLDQTDTYSDEEILSADTSDFSFLNDLDLDQDVVRRLTIYLQSVIRGNSDVFVTPICKRIDPTAILDKFDTIFKSNENQMNKVLIDLELSNRSKFGPRSIAKPWSERLPDVASYYENKRSITSQLSTILPNNKDHLRFRPLEPDNAVDLLKNSTNSGLPYYCKKGKIKDKLVSKFDYLKYRKDPCILFTRTQENNKTRNVWGFPAIDTLIEMCYYAVLLDYQKKLFWRSAIVSPEQVDNSITQMIDRALSNKLKIISIDFSSYDSSISVGLIRLAFTYVKALFQPIYHDTIDVICKRFYSIPLLTPSGVIKGNHGVPSGSTFTNEVDSLVQFIIAKSSNLIYDGDYQIQGDDGVYLVSNNDKEDFISFFESNGLNVNRDKSYISDDYCIYLQKLYHPDYRNKKGVIGGIYPLYRALNRIIYQERWANFEDFGLSGTDYYSIRTISILENCKYHPLFREFVEFIYSMDKYSLSFTREGLTKYCEMLGKSKGNAGTLYNQYGNDISGLMKFETVKIIKGLA